MFSRAERFAEKVPDVPISELSHTTWADQGTSAFDKSDRFKKDVITDEEYSYADDSLHKSIAIKKGTVNKEQHDGHSKAPKKIPTPDSGKVAELEKEVKKLLAERADLDKQLISSRGEVIKLEGKLQITVKDKSSLQAQVASLQKEKLDLARAKKVLQTKVDADCDVRKSTLLQTQLEQTGKKLNKELEIKKSQLAELTKQSQEELRKAKESNIKLTSELSTATNKHSESENACLVIQKELEAEREARKKETMELTNSFQEDLRKEKEVNTDLAHDLSRKTDQLSQSENGYREIQLELEAEKEARRKDMDELTKQSQEEIRKEKDLNTELSHDISMKTDQLAQSENAYQELQQMTADQEVAQKEIQIKLTSKVEELEEEVRSASEKTSGIKLELKTEQETQVQLQKKIASQSDQIVEIEKKTVHSSEKVRLAEERLVTEVEANKKLDVKLTQTVNISSQLEKDLESSANSLAGMEKKLITEKEARNKLKSSLTQKLQLVSKLEADIITANNSTKLAQDEVKAQMRKAKEESGVTQRHVRKLEKEVDELTKSRKSLQEEISRNKTSTSTLRAELQLEHKKAVESLTEKCHAHEKKLADQKETKTKLETLQHDHKQTVSSLTDKCLAFEEELARHCVESQETQALLRSQIQTMEESSHEQKDTEAHPDLLARIAELEEENKRLREDNIRLQEAYDEIEERYRPYKDQVDGLEGINLLLQNQTSLAQLEAQKLSEQYTKLLGHQNHKQKIQHVKKLKDENANLKQECAKLKTEVACLKKRLEDEGIVVSSVLTTKSKKKPAASGPPLKPLGLRNK